MDRSLVERMIGAGMLVLLLVLLVPTLLNGNIDDKTAPAAVTFPQPVLRTETIYLNGTKPPSATLDQGAPDSRSDLPSPAAHQTVAVTNDLAKATSAQWGVQLGSFSNQANAGQLVTDLIDQGHPAYVSATSGVGLTMYRVRVGPRPSRGSAAELARTLTAVGHEGMVMALTDEPRE